MKGITLINFRKLILNKGSPFERHPAVDLRLVYIWPVTHMLLPLLFYYFCYCCSSTVQCDVRRLACSRMKHDCARTELLRDMRSHATEWMRSCKHVLG